MKKEKLYKKIGENIKALRLKKGLTQEKLAFEAKLHRAYIGHIERGEKRIGLRNLYKISSALGVSIYHIIPKSE